MALAFILCILTMPLWLLHEFLASQAEALWYGTGYTNGLRRSWTVTRYYFRWLRIAAHRVVKGNPSWYSDHYGVD
jgi:hypothetical protein